MSRELKPCGTRAAYARHLRKGEPACEPCRKANVECTRRSEQESPAYLARQRARNAARERARVRLAGEYPDRFRELCNEEYRKLSEVS